MTNRWQETGALFSDCHRYRYTLWRRWGEGRVCLFVMLNPSTADEQANDPTVERCERRARAMQGIGGMVVCNLFALRSTDPKGLYRAADPVGPDNDAHILQQARQADRVICAWGNHGLHLRRGDAIVTQLRQAGIALHHLGLTKQAQPKHPLYLPYSARAVVWG